MDQYDTLIAPAAALIVGIVASIATMMANRERHSQKIERLSIAVRNVEGFPDIQNSLINELSVARLRMGYTSQNPVPVLLLQIYTYVLILALSALVYALFIRSAGLGFAALLCIIVYFVLVQIDNYFFEKYRTQNA